MMGRKLFCALAALCLGAALTGCGAAAPAPAPSAPAQTVQLAPAEQIALLAGQKDVWYQDGPEHDPAYLYYAVTDLNRNGRLEIVRSEFKYDTCSSCNRFFELDPSGAVVEMPLAPLPEGAPTEPGLVNAELPTECMYRDGVYRYRIPTPFYLSGGDKAEYLYMLCVDGERNVSTELLGVKRVSDDTGGESFFDGEGRPVEAREYYAADLMRYDGDRMATASWEWVMILDGYDAAEVLTQSWEQFRFDGE